MFIGITSVLVIVTWLGNPKVSNRSKAFRGTVSVKDGRQTTSVHLDLLHHT